MEPWDAHGPDWKAGPERSDACLMESIRAGDPQALQALMDRHWGALLRYAHRMLGSMDEAEDVAQHVFVSVWEHRERWIAGGTVRAYVFRIARNEALGRSRRNDVRRLSESEVRRRVPRVRTPLEETAFSEVQASFERTLEQLPPRRREAFSLVRLQGLSLREASEVMGVTIRTVTNHVYMAAQELSAALGPFLSTTVGGSHPGER